MNLFIAVVAFMGTLAHCASEEPNDCHATGITCEYSCPNDLYCDSFGCCVDLSLPGGGS